MITPLTIGVNDTARALGCGRTHVYRLISEGKIDTILLGRRRLVKTESLFNLVNSK